jgi:hypothetical protein
MKRTFALLTLSITTICFAYDSQSQMKEFFKEQEQKGHDMTDRINRKIAQDDQQQTNAAIRRSSTPVRYY